MNASSESGLCATVIRISVTLLYESVNSFETAAVLLSRRRGVRIPELPFPAPAADQRGRWLVALGQLAGGPPDRGNRHRRSVCGRFNRGGSWARLTSTARCCKGLLSPSCCSPARSKWISTGSSRPVGDRPPGQRRRAGRRRSSGCAAGCCSRLVAVPRTLHRVPAFRRADLAHRPDRGDGHPEELQAPEASRWRSPANRSSTTASASLSSSAWVARRRRPDRRRAAPNARSRGAGGLLRCARCWAAPSSASCSATRATAPSRTPTTTRSSCCSPWRS